MTLKMLYLVNVYILILDIYKYILDYHNPITSLSIHSQGTIISYVSFETVITLSMLWTQFAYDRGKLGHIVKCTLLRAHC